MFRILVMSVLMSYLCTAHSGIYTCKDKDGNTVYADSPDSASCVNAEEVTLPPLNTSKPLVYPPSTSTDSSASGAGAAGAYSSLEITSPSLQENIRSNEGNINIAYQASPALQAQLGHQYVVTLSGKEIYKGPNSKVAIQGLDRGTHVISAAIISSDGKTIISSPSVQFTLHRFSSLQGNANSPNTGSGSGGGDGGAGSGGDAGGGTPTPPPTTPGTLGGGG